MGILGEKQSMLGAVGEEMPPEAGSPEMGAPPVEEAPAENEEFEGVMGAIQNIQAGVQGVLDGMIDMEAQTVSDPEGVAGFAADIAMVLEKYQQSAPTGEPTPEV